MTHLTQLSERTQAVLTAAREQGLSDAPVEVGSDEVSVQVRVTFELTD